MARGKIIAPNSKIIWLTSSDGGVWSRGSFSASSKIGSEGVGVEVRSNSLMNSSASASFNNIVRLAVADEFIKELERTSTPTPPDYFGVGCNNFSARHVKRDA